MGGRGARPAGEREPKERQEDGGTRPWEADWPERERWIWEISEERLEGYRRMLDSAGAGHRVDGSARGDGGDYFKGLVDKETARRAGR